MWRLRQTRGAKFFLCLLVLSLLVPAGILADDCSAEAEADLEHKVPDGDSVHLQFSVDVSTQSDCAKILYDLVIEEMLPNGHTKKIRKPNVITLHDDSVSASIRHTMPSSHEMLSYEAKIVSCQPCEDV